MSPKLLKSLNTRTFQFFWNSVQFIPYWCKISVLIVNYAGLQVRLTEIIKVPNIRRIFNRYAFDPHFYTAANGDIQAMQQFLKDGGSPNARSSDNLTLLMGAVYGDQLPMVEYLVNHGASINSTGKYHGTVLMLAVHRNLNILQFLLKVGANLEIKNNKGQTALLLCCDQAGLNGAAKLLLNAGANPNTQDNAFYYPLACVIWRNDAKMVREFLNFGADLEMRSQYGHTPLHFAIKYASREIIEMLLEAGADSSAVDAGGVNCEQLIESEKRTDLKDLFQSAEDWKISK